MSLIEINKDPSPRDLRWFGVVVAAFCGLVGALLHWRFGASGAARVVWIAGGALCAVYYLAPGLRKTLYVGWMYACWPLGWIMSHVILGFAYYVVMTPIGLILRAVGADPMRRRFDRGSASYWTPHEGGRGGWFRQF